MTGWRSWFVLALAASLAGMGCHKSVAISLTIAPTNATTLINNTVQFTPAETGSTATITWSVAGVAATSTTTGGNSTEGTITSNGLYTAPTVVPPNPQVTVTATISGTSTSATATVTIQSGVSVTITNATSLGTIGTGEKFSFQAAVTGVPNDAVSSATPPTCNSVSPNPPTLPACTAVTWSVNGTAATPTTPAVTSGGTIDNNGNYTAPATATSGQTVTIKATSVYDTSVSAFAVISLVIATDPTVISVGPNVGSRGAIFQDVYLSGTNFISTTQVFIAANGSGTPVLVPNGDVTVSPTTCATLESSNPAGSTVPVPPCTAASLTTGATVMRVRVEDSLLAQDFSLPNTNSVILTFTVARQNGTPQPCAPSPANCQLVLSPAPPVALSVIPDSVQQPSGTGTFPIAVDGGPYGGGGTTLVPPVPNIVVTGQFDGQTAAGSSITLPGRQLQIPVPDGSASQPGLHQVGVISDTPGLPASLSNFAVQPAFSSSPAITATLTAGNKPTAVAVNTATGIAVVASQVSNDVTLIDLSTNTVVTSICTAGPSVPETCPATAPTPAPTGVAVDNIRNMALVVNSGTNKIAVVDLAQKKVTFAFDPSLVLNNSAVAQVPVAVGISPATARAIVAYRGTNFGLLLDVSACPLGPPVIVGIVSIGEGSTPRIAVSAKLNLALITPGGLGSFDLVNLGQQRSNTIQSATVTSGTVTVTTTATHTLSVGQAVLICAASPCGSNPVGLVNVASVPSSTTFTYTQAPSQTTTPSGTVLYSLAVATLAASSSTTGIGLNEETFQAVLADPFGGVTIFNTLDESSSSLPSAAVPNGGGMIGAAFNSLADIAVVINENTNQGFVIDPGDPDSQRPPRVLTTFSIGANAWDLAIDPGTDTAVVINQQASGNVNIVPLGGLRTPQVLEVQADCTTGASSDTCGPSSEIFAPSSFKTAVAPAGSVNLRIIGKGLSSGSTVFLDGMQFSPSSNPVPDRVITITVPTATLAGPHRYSLYVSNSGTVSNAEPVRVIQSISLSGAVSGTCTAPSPVGVAIDAPNNLAVVSDNTCNQIYLVNMANGLVSSTVTVGTGPLGVAVSPQGGSQSQGGVVAVANAGSNNVSLLDDLQGGGTQLALVATDANPAGVAIEPVLGQVVVAANGANTIDTFPISATSKSTFVPTPVGQGPVSVAVDPNLHLAAVGNLAGNSVTVQPLVASNFTGAAFTVEQPLGISYDPISGNFLAAASTSNEIFILNPSTQQSTAIGLGINPTSIAYNFATSTLVSANTAGGTMSVVDFISQRVREVFPLTSSGLFSVAIHPQTNVAVVADSANRRILLVPLP